MPEPHINICVVTYNRLSLTRLCLESLFSRTQGDYTAHIVDNNSTDGTVAYLKDIAAKQERAKVIFLGRNYGPAVAANYAWAALDADYYVKLDNDIYIHDGDWLHKLVRLAERNPEIAMVGYRLLDWKDENTPLRLKSGDAFISSQLCNGGCVLISRKTFFEFGFWNEDYGRYGFEDNDYSLRVRLADYLTGYPSMNCAEVEHMGFMPGLKDEPHEQGKKKKLQKNYQGYDLFVVNHLLYAEKIRSLRIERKYLPRHAGDSVTFTFNPEYRSISALQAALRDKISYCVKDKRIHTDVSRLKI
jgi:glycosyltransferase involved in cell wall biosynthesis